MSKTTGIPKNIKVALVADWLTSPGGAEKVVRQLADLFPRAPIYTTVYNSDRLPGFRKKRIVTSFLQRIPLARRRHQWFISLMPLAISRFSLSEYDLVISSSHTIAHGVKTSPHATHICYCHTPVRWAFTPKVDNLKERLPLGFLADLITKYFRRFTTRRAQQVTHFIANSSYIAARIKRFWSRDASIVYPPVDVDLIPFKATKKDFYLTAGRLIPYKKTDIIIRAFSQLGWPLKVVGIGPELSRLRRLAGPNIKFLGFVSDQTLRRLLGEARAFVFAAREDFGIAPVEAMAAGTPVIGYGRGGLRETVIDGKTGVYFDRQTPASLIAAARRAAQLKFDARAIRRQARRFAAIKFNQAVKKEIKNYLNQ